MPGPEDDIKDMLDPLLRTFGSILQAEVQAELVTAYMQGSAEMITWGKTKAGIPIAFEGPPVTEAIEYARTWSGVLVKRMNEETVNRLAQVIGDGIQNKRGIPGLTRDLKKEFTDMSRYRAETIARTETNNALSQAFLDRGKEMDIEAKEWIVTDPCPICEENAAEGIKPLDHVFSSGQTRPPAHPRCLCSLAPARFKNA